MKRIGRLGQSSVEFCAVAASAPLAKSGSAPRSARRLMDMIPQAHFLQPLSIGFGRLCLFEEKGLPDYGDDTIAVLVGLFGKSITIYYMKQSTRKLRENVELSQV